MDGYEFDPFRHIRLSFLYVLFKMTVSLTAVWRSGNEGLNETTLCGPKICPKQTKKMAAGSAGRDTFRSGRYRNSHRQKSREYKEDSDSEDDELFDGEKLKTRLMSMWNNVRHGECQSAFNYKLNGVHHCTHLLSSLAFMCIRMQGKLTPEAVLYAYAFHFEGIVVTSCWRNL